MKKEIIKKINSMSGSQSPYNIFCDWIELMALSLANSLCIIHNQTWHEREKKYIQIAEKYSKDDMHNFVNMFAWLTKSFEERTSDILGEIYMESGCGNKNTGQFFTPYNISLMVAESSIPKAYDGSYPLTVNEPSCGGGGMIIAFAESLKKKGFNYQQCMRVIAQDLDWKGVYMCYVQLSLLGIDAVVVQGNTLTEPCIDNYPRSRIFRTPRNMGLLI